MFWNIKISYFFFFNKKWGITKLGPYIKQRLKCIKSLDKRKKSQSSWFSLRAYDLASFSFFLFLTSCFLFFTSFILNIWASWLLYWIPIYWAYCFFCVLAIKSSVLLWFKITRPAIASLAALKVLCRKICLG